MDESEIKEEKKKTPKVPADQTTTREEEPAKKPANGVWPAPARLSSTDSHMVVIRMVIQSIRAAGQINLAASDSDEPDR